VGETNGGLFFTEFGRFRLYIVVCHSDFCFVLSIVSHAIELLRMSPVDQCGGKSVFPYRSASPSITVVVYTLPPSILSLPNFRQSKP
jgi:hypothetical protein